MANTKNLKHFTSNQSHEKAVRNGKKGGIASGISKRNKKATAELCKMMLNAPCNDEFKETLEAFGIENVEDMTNNALRVAGVIKKAQIDGDDKANRYLDELIDKAERQEINENRYSLSITDITSDYVECYRKVHETFKNGILREIINKGGRGSIKSTFWAAVAEETILQDPQAHVVMCRRYKTDLKDSVYNQFMKTCIRHGTVDDWEFSKSPLMAKYKATGQCVMFVGCDKPISLKSYNVTFGYVKMIIFEECDEMAGIEQIDNVEDTFLRGNCNSISVKVFNPPKSVNNWMNEYTAQKASDPATYICHSYYYNVPVEWLGQRFFDRAEAFRINKPQYYANNYLGEVTGTGGTIFDNLEFRTITEQEEKSFDYLYYGLDFGFEHPQAFIQCAYDSEAETVYPLYELRKVRMKQENFAKRLIKDFKEKGINILCKDIKADSARPDNIDEWQDYGFEIYGATKRWKGGGRSYSWEWMQTRTKIVIDEARTPYLAKEMRTAEFEQLKDGSFSSNYPTLKEDCIMALIYSLNDVIRDEKNINFDKEIEDEE